MNPPVINCVIAAGSSQAKEISAMVTQLPGYKISAVFTGAKKLSDYLNKQSPQIAIVDLDIKDFNGYAFLQQVTSATQIIALSSASELAVEGYAHHTSGYLVKPVTQSLLADALQNAAATICNTQPLMAAHPKQHPFIFIRAEYKLMRINFEDILYIEGLKDYSKIYTTPAAGKAIITLQNLKSFEEKLSPDDFIRVHRSYIVSLAKIDVIHKNSILIGKHEIPVSDGFRPNLFSAISKYM